MRLISTVVNLVYVLNDLGVASKSPFGDVVGEKPLETIHLFLEHLTLGIVAPTEDIPADFAEHLDLLFAAWTGVNP